MDLTNFRVFDFNEGLPYVSITSNGLTFNKSVIMKMNYPAYVRLLINETDARAVQFYKQNPRNILSVRFNSKDLINTIERICEWNLENTSYRVNGVIVPEADLMLFNLSDATPMT